MQLKLYFRQHTVFHQFQIPLEEDFSEKMFFAHMEYKKVGKILGQLCYFNFKHKRPDTDYPDQVYLLSTFGVDVGDLNHSQH